MGEGKRSTVNSPRAVLAGLEVLLVVSVDTEEDNWVPTRVGISVEKVRELKRLSGCFDGVGVRATYFTSYQVATRPWAVDVLREICDDGRAEIGAHLPPWNTPPIDEPLVLRNTMMKNLPPKLQLAKLERLTSQLADVFGAPPTAFRAGRFGLGAEAVPALVACGYQVDSSVTPFMSWEAMDDGPNFVGASLDAYRVGTGRDIRVRTADGPLVEIPITCWYTRFASWRFPGLHRVLPTRPARALHLAGLAPVCQTRSRTAAESATSLQSRGLTGLCVATPCVAAPQQRIAEPPPIEQQRRRRHSGLALANYAFQPQRIGVVMREPAVMSTRVRDLPSHSLAAAEAGAPTHWARHGVPVESNARRLLVISYHFRADGVVGGLRWAGVTKYLARLGWQVAVLTAAPPAPGD